MFYFSSLESRSDCSSELPSLFQMVFHTGRGNILTVWHCVLLGYTPSYISGGFEVSGLVDLLFVAAENFCKDVEETDHSLIIHKGKFSPSAIPKATHFTRNRNDTATCTPEPEYL